MIRCVETGEVYDDAKQVKMETGITGLYKVLNGNKETVGGFHWVEFEKPVRENDNKRSKKKAKEMVDEVISSYRADTFHGINISGENRHGN